MQGILFNHIATKRGIAIANCVASTVFLYVCVAHVWMAQRSHSKFVCPIAT